MRRKMPMNKLCSKTAMLQLVVVTIFAVLLSSCTSGDSDTTESNELSASPYLGTWMSGCVQDDDDESEYLVETYTFTEDSFLARSITYLSADCSGAPILFASGVFQGDYQELNDITTGEGLLAREINYTIRQLELINGTAILDTSLIGQTVLDIMHIDEGGFLYFGLVPDDVFLPEDGSSNERPTMLDLALPHTRQ